MNNFVIGVVKLVLVVVLFTPAILVAYYVDDVSFGTLKITFKRFLTLYSVAPCNWQLKDSAVSYKCFGDFRFGFFDWIKYRLWRKAQRRASKQAADNNLQRKLIESWLKDIDDYRKQWGGVQNDEY